MLYGFCDPALGLYKLPEHVRLRFRQPLGKLYGAEDINRLIERLRSYVKEGYIIVSVGDRVTKTLITYEIPVKVAIIDKKERRHQRVYTYPEFFSRVVVAENPAGAINFRLCRYVEEALVSEGSTLIYVIGEEDLVGVIVILLGKKDVIMVYGQPDQGIILCNIDNNLVDNVRKLLEVET